MCRSPPRRAVPFLNKGEPRPLTEPAEKEPAGAAAGPPRVAPLPPAAPPGPGHAGAPGRAGWAAGLSPRQAAARPAGNAAATPVRAPPAEAEGADSEAGGQGTATPDPARHIALRPGNPATTTGSGT